jgi:hypothetical protein
VVHTDFLPDRDMGCFRGYPECLAELKALEDEEDESTQQVTKK